MIFMSKGFQWFYRLQDDLAWWMVPNTRLSSMKTAPTSFPSMQIILWTELQLNCRLCRKLNCLQDRSLFSSRNVDSYLWTICWESLIILGQYRNWPVVFSNRSFTSFMDRDNVRFFLISGKEPEHKEKFIMWHSGLQITLAMSFNNVNCLDLLLWIVLITIIVYV